MSKVIFVAIVCIFLSACSTTPPPKVTFDENFSHPELPNPVQPYKFGFHVITEKNVESFVDAETAYVAIDYEETLIFRQFLEDMKRFMLEANGVICYYRKELEEQFCINQKKYLDRNDKVEE